MSVEIARESWSRDGFIIRPGLLPESEVLGFRERALELAHRFHGGNFVNKPLPVDLLSDPVFRSLVLDTRILDLAREVIGPRLVYFGDSKATIVTMRGTFHQDNALRGIWPRGQAYDPFDAKEGPYNVLRVFIYLQDHRKFAGNLQVRRGSHRQTTPKYVLWPRDLFLWLTNQLKTFPTPPHGKRVNMNTALGDVVVMNLRTTHRANAVRLSGLPQFGVPSTIEKLVPRAFRAPELPFRMVLIVTLGAPGLHLERFIQSRVKLARSDHRYRSATFDSAATQRLASDAGLELRFDLIQYAREQPSHPIGT
jgi:Phytanoyl-CoA dioxygenase (PhyH)